MSKRSKATIAEIAAIAGISPATVSRVLNHPELVSSDTKETVYKVIDMLDYAPRSCMGQVLSDPIIMINVQTHMRDLYGEIIDGASAAASAAGYKVIITQDRYDTEQDIERLMQNSTAQNVIGIIFINPQSSFGFQKLLLRFPIVQVWNYKSDSITYITINNRKAVLSVLHHLLSLGRRNITLLTGVADSPMMTERRDTYIDFMSSEGLSSATRIISVARADYSLAYAAVLQLLDSPSVPDAIVATSDLFAVAAVNAATVKGLRVPEDIAVTGFDNDNNSLASRPQLTTIDQHCYQMGYSAANLIAQYNSHRIEKTARNIRLETDLIIRGSTIKQ